MGGSGSARRPRRRIAGSSHLKPCGRSGATAGGGAERASYANASTISLRRLADTPKDVALGQEIVREYVVATAEEQAGPNGTADVEAILPYVPDWDDFAGRFLRSGGAFVVATVDGALAGCVGVTRLDTRVCEMNRLWVRPPFRALGLGTELAVASMEEARRLGFTRMLLDVLPQRRGAIELYRKLGFVEVPPIHEYAFPMVFLGRDL